MYYFYTIVHQHDHEAVAHCYHDTNNNNNILESQMDKCNAQLMLNNTINVTIRYIKFEGGISRE